MPTCSYANNLIIIFDIFLEIIASEFVYWWRNGADDYISTLHSILVITDSELCTVVCWWNDSTDKKHRQ